MIEDSILSKAFSVVHMQADRRLQEKGVSTLT